MGRPIRYLPNPGCLVEVTAQTFQGRKFLRPDPEVTDVVLGILGKALQRYPETNLVSYQYMSTHPHLQAAPDSQWTLSRFMQFVQANISKEVGTRIRDWPGAFWHGRFKQVPILDDVKAVERLKYVLSNSVKENLVETIEEWPGACCVQTLLTGKPNEGTWYDRTAEYNARRRKGGENIDLSLFAETVEVPLAPLPCWAHLTQEERADEVRGLLIEIRDEAAAKRAESKVTVLGADEVLAADPIERPAVHKRKPRVWCFAASPELRMQYMGVVRGTIESYDIASKAFRAGDHTVEFPQGTIRPNGGFVDWTDDTAGSTLEWIASLSLT